MSECKCNVRTQVLGDGCSICNPMQALEYARQTISDLQEEITEERAHADKLAEALRNSLNHYIPANNYRARDAVREVLAEHEERRK